MADLQYDFRSIFEAAPINWRELRRVARIAGAALLAVASLCAGGVMLFFLQINDWIPASTAGMAFYGTGWAAARLPGLKPPD